MNNLLLNRYIFLGKPSISITNFIWDKIFNILATTDLTVSMYLKGTSSRTVSDLHLEYSVNQTKWILTWDGSAISLKVGDKLYIRNMTNDANNCISKSSSDYFSFRITNKAYLGGNILYLLANNGSRADVPMYCFFQLFYNTPIISAPELPSMTLATVCYNSMFANCTLLTIAPKLPAKILTSSCYGYMFRDCVSLTKAPDLPATHIASTCYNNMFKGCLRITKAPELPATILKPLCYNAMFMSCSQLLEAPKLPAIELSSKCYTDMFLNCSKFTVVYMKTTIEGTYDPVVHGKFDEPNKIVQYDLDEYVKASAS